MFIVGIDNKNLLMVNQQLKLTRLIEILVMKKILTEEEAQEVLAA